MNNNKTKGTDNDIRIYEIKRKNIVPFTGKIPVFILHHKKCENLVTNIERDIKDYNIETKKDISEFDSYYNDIINVFDEVKYMVVLVTKDFLLDWALMEILLNNYNLSESNYSIIPLIIDDILYDPIEKTKIIKSLHEYSTKYVNEYFVKDYNDEVPAELEKMQRIIKMAKDFLNFSLKRDKKSNKPFSQKIIKYIESDMGTILKNEEGDNKMHEQSGITNNFYCPINKLQIQQGNRNATQNQSINQSNLDYDSIQKMINEIKKKNDELDSVYGENVNEVRKILDEVTLLIENKNDSGKIKDTLLLLKDLSVGISGSLIASGIVSWISNLNL